MTLLAGLQGILDSRNMKPADLCRLCGMSSGAISSYMNGKRVPSIATARRPLKRKSTSTRSSRALKAKSPREIQSVLRGVRNG